MIHAQFAIASAVVFSHIVEMIWFAQVVLLAVVVYAARSVLETDRLEPTTLCACAAFGLFSLWGGYWAMIEIGRQLAGDAFMYAPLTGYAFQASMFALSVVCAAIFGVRKAVR